ncbi:IQ domain-containing protein K [Discoglossus pictus]
MEPPEQESVWERSCAEYDMELPSLPGAFLSRQEPMPCVKNKVNLAGESGPRITDSTQAPSELPDPTQCSAQTYIEHYMYPVLLPGMAEMLNEAKKEKCFERKKTKFIAFDFLTQWLYNLNPKRKEQPFTGFFEIPFVQQWLKDHPRPPIPRSLLMSEEEAALYIQAFWRGYRVRCDPEVQELRQWQRDLKETKVINKKVTAFWNKHEPKVEIDHMDEVGRASPTEETGDPDTAH